MVARASSKFGLRQPGRSYHPVDVNQTPCAAAISTGGAPRVRLPPAFRHRNYRLYFFGQGLSVLGTWMQRMAMPWLVYRLSGSELLLGVTGFISNFPVLVLAPLGGLLADRFDRRKLLAATQALAMLQAFALAALTWSGTTQVWHVLALAGVLGVINAFDTPTRQSLAVELLDDRRDLPSAIALNSLVNNSGRLIGPSVAGVILAAFSESACFLVNALSYVAVLAALACMRTTPQPRPHHRRSLGSDLRGAFTSAWRFPPIRLTLTMVILVGFMVMPYTTMMPAFVAVLGGGAHTMGFLVSAAGIGAVSGSAFLAWRPSIAGLWRVLALAAGTAGGGLALFALSPWPWVCGALMVAVGAGAIVAAASANTILQSIVADDMRGRIASLYTMAFMGMSPMGALALGAMAEAAGIRVAFVVGGTVCVLGALLFARRLPALRQALAKDQPATVLP
jgi:MFS family permease